MIIDLEVFIDILGWIGAIALLIAYGLVSARRIQGDSASYQWLNLVGALLLILNTVYYGAYPSAFLNGFWMAVAVYSVGKIGWRALHKEPSSTATPSISTRYSGEARRMISTRVLAGARPPVYSSRTSPAFRKSSMLTV